LADIGRHDLVYPHRAEPRHDVLADRVGVALAGGDLHHVMGKPLPLNVLPEGLPASTRITHAALSLPDLCHAPCLVSVPLAIEGPGHGGLAAGVTVIGGVPHLALEPGALPRPSHDDHFHQDLLNAA